MQFSLIPKQEDVPSFDPSAVKVQYIERFGAGELTAEKALELLKKRPFTAQWYLFPDPEGEGEFLEVLCDGTWLALGWSDGGQENIYSYNPDFAGVKEPTGLRSGGQTPVEKELALTDIAAGVKAVEFFIRTGERWPGIDWARQL